MDKLISFLVNKILKITLDQFVRPLGELQELLSEAEDPYFELQNGGFQGCRTLVSARKMLAQLRFNTAKLDLVDGQLLANDEICATSGSKVTTRAVNKLKMRSKIGKVASVGF